MIELFFKLNFKNIQKIFLMYWTELVNTKAIFVEQQYNYLSNNFWLGFSTFVGY